MRFSARSVALAAVAAYAPCTLGMRRKATDTLEVSFNTNLSKANESVAARANESVAARAGVNESRPACPGLTTWTLVMQSEQDDGWRGASMHVSHCNGTSVLANQTLLSGRSKQETLCLPARFMVEVRGSPDAKGMQWSLASTGSGAKSLSGGVPSREGLCPEANQSASLLAAEVGAQANASASSQPAESATRANTSASSQAVQLGAKADTTRTADKARLAKAEPDIPGLMNLYGLFWGKVWQDAFDNYWRRYEHNGQMLNVQTSMMSELIGVQFR